MDDALQQKFPDLKIGAKPSGLGSVNGFGSTLVGHRDPDPESGTYVTTHCITALFIPLFPISAYRVASAPGGGWYVLGRVPLSKFAKGWNILLLVMVLAVGGGFWWNHHIHTPEYLAGEKLNEAEKAAAAGEGGRAAELCRDVIDGRTDRVGEAKTKLTGLIQEPPGAPAQAAKVYAVAVDLHRRGQCPVADLFVPGKAIAERRAADDPKAALALLEVIAPHAPDPAAELALRQSLLEKLVARDPANPATVSRLAVVYEAKGEHAKCRALLVPLENRLGSLDGAAVLGRIYAAAGDHDKALALLGPFVDARLPAFQQADRNMTAQAKAAETRIVELLKKGDAPGFDYTRYERLNKNQQSAMVDDYIGNRIKGDPVLRQARQQLSAQAVVVPAVLDLGLVRLQRGQAAADPAVRKRELEAAEKAFLSIHSVAEESDQLRLNLGQVYYWLGRPADGKKQFDALLAARGRAALAVMMVCTALREVGAVGEAREQAEAAYATEKDLVKKNRLARLRALMQIDLDDHILWLSRSDQNEQSVQASLAHAMGAKAAQDGDDEAAAREYRKCIEINEKMPEGPTPLNNAALAHFALAQIAHDRAEFTRGLDKIDRAIALQPSDSILLSNAADSVLDNALRDTASTSVDLTRLKHADGWELLAYLYLSPAERKPVVDRLAGHPGLVKSRGYLERLLTLAPKRSDAYESLTAIHGFFRDVNALKSLLVRVREAELDLTDATRRTKDRLAGVDAEKRKDEYLKALARVEEGLTKARMQKDRTFAAAVARVVQFKIGGYMLGEPTDAEALVKLAEEAHAAAPSSGTESTLMTALTFRAHTALMKSNAAYQSMARRTARSFGPTFLLYALSSGGPLAKAAAENPDVRRLAELAREEYRREPAYATPRMWAIMSALYPDEGKGMAEKVSANERSHLRFQIERLLSPLSVGPALDEFWWLKIAGKDGEADKVLAELGSLGVPVPTP